MLCITLSDIKSFAIGNIETEDSDEVKNNKCEYFCPCKSILCIYRAKAVADKNVQFTIATVNRRHNGSVTEAEVGIVTAWAATDV